MASLVALVASGDVCLTVATAMVVDVVAVGFQILGFFFYLVMDLVGMDWVAKKASYLKRKVKS